MQSGVAPPSAPNGTATVRVVQFGRHQNQQVGAGASVPFLDPRSVLGTLGGV